MSNTDVVVRLAAAKHAATRQRVVEVLQSWPDDRPMTFAAVCQRAKVSKTFLYGARQADLATQIRLRRSQAPAPPVAMPRGKTDTAKDAQIMRLQERLRQQEQELGRLRAENMVLYGRLAEHP